MNAGSLSLINKIKPIVGFDRMDGKVTQSAEATQVLPRRERRV
jgi:hypothetical protein